MKVGIIGIGIVGSATKAYLEKVLEKKKADFDLVLYDTDEGKGFNQKENYAAKKSQLLSRKTY